MDLDKNVSIAGIVAGEDKVTLITATGETIFIKFCLSNMDILPDLIKTISESIGSGKPCDINFKQYIDDSNAGDYSHLDAYAKIGLTISGNNPYATSESVNTNHSIDLTHDPDKVKFTLESDNDSVDIENPEGLLNHIDRAKEESSQAIINLITRLKPIIDKRKHSIDSLLEFLTSNDLPITENGDILAYKALNWRSELNAFVDYHTGKITQGLGTVVSIDEKLVDTNRHNAHSTGLHVGNKEYRNSSYGNLTTIVLVKPEDFITVPQSQNNKGRVSEYTIVGVLTKHGFDFKPPNYYDSKFIYPMEKETDLIDKLCLGHMPKLVNKIEIEGGRILSNVPYKSTTSKTKEISKVKRSGKVIESKPDPKKTTPKGKVESGLISRLDSKVVARQHYENKSFKELYALKRKAKKPWTHFNFNKAEIADIEAKVKALKKDEV